MSAEDKQPLLPRAQVVDAAVHAQIEREKAFRRRLPIALLVVGLWLSIAYFSEWYERSRPAPPRVKRPREWGFPNIPTSSKLVYHPCFEGGEVDFECARLWVPLDHFNQSTEQYISLAIIRKPAGVPVTDPRYGGALLTNPGGPGGSGVGFLQRGYKSLDAAIHNGVDSDDTKFYDLISFDPRGVGLSEPTISCFESDLLSWTWELRTAEEGIFGSSDAAFGRLYSMFSALSASCSLSAKDPEDIKRFVSTASVATDMLHIIERHGQWREAEARRCMDDIPDTVLYKQGKETINYWGFSYGTYLGVTFASMYPDRIQRFVIDGVVDAVDYTKALWYNDLGDTEKAMDGFYDHCASAGYPACVLANKTGESTSAGVRERVSTIINSLVHDPLPVIGEHPDVVTYSDVMNLLFAAVYTPIPSSPFVANALLGIEEGDGSILASVLRPYHEPYCRSGNTVSALWGPLRNFTSGTQLSHDATMAIACSDGDSQANVTRGELKEHWKKLAEISPTVGPQWAAFRMQCAKYTVRPNHRYAGPWTGETSFPILLIGNSADPVTPVRHARKMAKGYKDARVLEQGSAGHCSASSPSKCTRKVIYDYFQHGVLPEKDSFCPADAFPFGDMSAEAEEITMAWYNAGLGAMMAEE